MGSKNKKNKKAAAESAEQEPEPKAPDGGDNNNRGKKLIADARFAFSHSDPRFQTHTKQKSKVKIDSRFNRMFTDKNFSTSSTSIDKRGKAKRKDTPNPLKHYYRMNGEDEEEEKEKDEVKGRNEEAVSDDNDEIDKSSDEDDDDDNDEIDKSKSESESGSELEGDSDNDDDHGLERDSGGSSDSDFDSDDEVYLEEEKQEEENIPEIDKETNRLAVVNMDWNQVKAVDLYVLLSSFLPKDGHILSVSVYPSDFGLKRMEEEAVHGPIGLFDDDKKKSESDDEDELDNEKLRAYELSRLRYYYAVVECDSIATADYIYKTCDGLEFERSSNKLDLRFIPDSMEIKHAPRDVAKEAPADYEGVDFETRALQQSKIQLTWDEDEPQRSKTLKRKYNADQLAELELKEFLASDESESDEDENDNGDRSGKKQKKQEMYRALIQSGDGSDGDEEEEGGQDMEVTFNTGLEDISKKILEKRDKKSENVWEAILRKKKEKKKSLKNRSKDSSDYDSDTDREPSDEPNDFFIEEEEEPAIKEHKKARGKSGKKGKKKDVETAEDEASRAELELLLADNNGESAGLKGYNLKRKKGKGKKKGENVLDEEKIPKVDYEDERFSSLFTSHLYALDPTDPQFKRSAAHARQIAQKKHMEESNKPSGRTQVVPDQLEPTKEEPVHAVDSSSKKDKYKISSLVKSIKMKSKNAQVQSNVKTSRRKGI